MPVQGQHGEGDVARDRHGRAQDVDQLHRRVLAAEQIAVGVAVARDHVQRAVVGRLDLAGAHRVDQAARPVLAALAAQESVPGVRTQRAGAIDHRRERRGAPARFVGACRHPGPLAGRAPQHVLRGGVHLDRAERRPVREAGAPLRRRQADQALALQRAVQRHQHGFSIVMLVAVRRMAAREAAGLVEHARRVLAAHAQRAPQQDAGAERIRAELLAAPRHETVALAQQCQRIVETVRMRQRLARVGTGRLTLRVCHVGKCTLNAAPARTPGRACPAARAAGTR